MLDADGKGEKKIALPEEALNPWNVKSVSPDGHWLAFYTGSLEPPYDLALNLLDLSTGSTQTLTPVLSPDYPENFNPAATQSLERMHWDFTVEEMARMLSDLFYEGIKSFAWSPNGRYLAFAGQMDGLSSDVYLYDTLTHKILRRSDGPEEILTIVWSPNGQWIVHSSNAILAVGPGDNYYAASVDGTSIKNLTASNRDIGGWLSPDQYLQADAANGPGTYNLMKIDLTTGTNQTLWAGSLDSYAVDPANRLLAVVGYETTEPVSSPSLYLVNLQTSHKQKIQEIKEGLQAYVNFLGFEDKRFIVYGISNNSPLFLKQDGSMEIATGEVLGVSPDGHSMVINSQGVLQVYNEAGMREIHLPNAAAIQNLIWRPDSSGLFFTLEERLYTLALDTGEFYFVGTYPTTYDYLWVKK